MGVISMIQVRRQVSRALLVLSFILPGLVFGKRVPPKPVTPVVYAGVRYSAPNDNGTTAYVLAADAETGKELWRATIFRSTIKPYIEEDVQWVFITELKLDDNSLLVRDEKSRCYRLDLATRRSKRHKCG